MSLLKLVVRSGPPTPTWPVLSAFCQGMSICNTFIEDEGYKLFPQNAVQVILGKLLLFVPGLEMRRLRNGESLLRGIEMGRERQPVTGYKTDRNPIFNDCCLPTWPKFLFLSPAAEACIIPMFLPVSVPHLPQQPSCTATQAVIERCMCRFCYEASGVESACLVQGSTSANGDRRSGGSRSAVKKWHNHYLSLQSLSISLVTLTNFQHNTGIWSFPLPASWSKHGPW